MLRSGAWSWRLGAIRVPDLRTLASEVSSDLPPGPSDAQIPPSSQIRPEPGRESPAPDNFLINFETSRGPFVVEITRALAPHGADRIYNLVRASYFDGSRFYRVVPGFMAQWGAAADPQMTQAWDRSITDDPVRTTNARGTITFAATSQPNSRTTHVFINFVDNGRLDAMGFAPIGKVVSGMENVDQIYAGDSERPDQRQINQLGNEYLLKFFPDLDYIITARLAR
jgi:peptidyl-prolyl cis-trans isomerase A (cyclophilin A)